MNYLFLLFFACTLAHAQTNNDVTHRPKSFAYRGNKAVFVDFQEATYFLTYDLEAKTSRVRALLKMEVVEEGHPVFDLVNDPSSVKIDGETTSAPEVMTPSKETTVRVLGRKLSVGKHELEVSVPLNHLVNFNDGVRSAFWVTDLEDRYYLEKYIPSSFEYDRMSITFNIQFKGLKTAQHLFANGKVTWLDPENATIAFPPYFTVNSLYFHTTPVGSVDLTEFNFTSSNGRSLPVTVYTAKNSDSSRILEAFTQATRKTLRELESDYGPFRHPSVTIYNARLTDMGLGGMEYAGATVTNLSSLSHELTHSYFGRGFTPANGNAGWIDESIASWRDDGYNSRDSLSGSSRMAAGPYYTRKTDTAAYDFGARFMAYLNGKFAAKGGLKPFLNALLERKLFTPIFAEEFVQEMERFYGEPLIEIFKTYVYGSPLTDGELLPRSHPVHRKMGTSELLKIL